MVGRLIAIAILCAHALAPVARVAGQEQRSASIADEWGPVWEALTKLETYPRQSAEFVVLHAELLQTAARRESAARKRSDRPMAFRARVLAAHLARLDGFEGRRVREPGVRIEFLPGEARLCATATLPGPTRTAALVRTLEDSSPEELGQSVSAFEDAIEEDLRGLRVDLAEKLARAWFRQCATPENQLLLARVLRLAGRHTEALALLDGVDLRAVEPALRALVLVERARHFAALGDAEAELDCYGAALAAGSRPAVFELARLHAIRGRMELARPLARDLLEEQTHAPRARRLWALALAAPSERLAASKRSNP